MTKFIEALEVQIDPEHRQRAKQPFLKCLGSPITLTPDLCRMDLQNRYLLRLVWNVSVWFDSCALPSTIEGARKEAMRELSKLVYGEIYTDIAELKFHIDYGDNEDALKVIKNIMTKIGMHIHE